MEKTKKQRRRFGQQHWRARYTDREIDAALTMLDAGASQRRVAVKMEVPRRTLRDWATGLIRARRDYFRGLAYAG